MGRFYTPRGLRHFNKMGIKMVGTAFTVKTAPGDNLMVHKALTLAKEGDVIIVDSCGNKSRALIGGIMCRLAKEKGLAGMVIDGLIRDSNDIWELGLPVYAYGTSPGGPYKEGPGEINTTISCAGVVVEPGDVVIGDDDGLVIVPQRNAETILLRTRKKKAHERDLSLKIETGRVDYSWIDELLKNKGCEFVD
jgi:RraA family protein